VTGEIVHANDLTWLKRRDENFFDIGSKALAVDRAVEDPWGVDAIMAQRRHKGHCLPVAVRNLGFEPLAARRPTPQRRHIGVGPGLIDEDQALGRDPGLIFFPLLAPAGDVRAVLLAGKHGFF
jgi:hypothetical protein